MRNNKVTMLHDPRNGDHLFLHKPSGLQFGVEGNFPDAYLVDCVAFPNREGFDPLHQPGHLDVLEDFKVITRFNFSEFVFHPCCPNQMNQLLAFIKSCPCLEEPEIVVSESFFNHVYGLTK